MAGELKLANKEYYDVIKVSRDVVGNVTGFMKGDVN